MVSNQKVYLKPLKRIFLSVRNHDHNHNHNQNRNGMRRTSTQSYAPRNFASGGGRINPENRQRSQQEKPSFLLPPTAISLPFFSMSMGGAAPLPPPPILAFDRNSGSSRGSSSGSSSGSSAGASSLLPGVSVQIGQSNQSNQQQSDENKAKSPAEYFLSKWLVELSILRFLSNF